MPDVPYEAIADDLKAGRLIPFLGAGASLRHSLETPNTHDDAASSSELRTAPSPTPPSAWELAAQLARYGRYPGSNPEEYSDLARVASFCEWHLGRKRMIEFLRRQFDQNFEIQPVHRFIARQDQPLLIMTTNYDDLLERALREAGKRFYTVVYPTEKREAAASVVYWPPNQQKAEVVPFKDFSIADEDASIIYKMHGTVDRLSNSENHFVITEEDYVSFLARMTTQQAIPATLRVRFLNSHFLFLGYGLRDWNLRVLLKTIWGQIPSSYRESGTSETIIDENNTLSEPDEVPSWAVQLRLPPVEELLWRRRGVQIYDVDLARFVSGLESAMPEGARG